MINHLLTLLAYTTISQTAFVNGYVSSEHLRAQHSISLEKRYEVKSVNEVFKDNILLTLNYMSKNVTKKEDINWDNIRKPSDYVVTLAPGETFTFNEDLLPHYEKDDIITTKAHYNFDDGFKSDGYLYGDGVCHLASLIFWTAKDAGLKAEAPTNHNFAAIPEVPKEFGVSIYYNKGQTSSNSLQNLYVTNDKNTDYLLKFRYNGKELSVGIWEANK